MPGVRPDRKEEVSLLEDTSVTLVSLFRLSGSVPQRKLTSTSSPPVSTRSANNLADVEPISLASAVRIRGGIAPTFKTKS